MQSDLTSDLTYDVSQRALTHRGLSYGYLVKHAGLAQSLTEPTNTVSTYPSRGRRIKPGGLTAFRRRSLLGVVLLAPVMYLAAHVTDASHSVLRYLGMTDAPSVTLSKVLAARTLTVATVHAPSTYFAQDGFEHGFGLDVMQGYAKHLGVTLNTVVFADASAARAAVNAGQADMALVNQTSVDTAPALASLSVSCQPADTADTANTFGLGHHLALQVPQTDGTLPANLSQYLCDQQTLKTHAQLADFYRPQVFDNDFSEQHFHKTMTQTLPIYRQAFMQNAKAYQLDWELLVAMGYQESHLDADAVSPTGVRGIMMLSTATAEELGVTDRVDPLQSIAGGAKYVSQIRAQFADASPSDQLWFTLAAYNMGAQAVKDIQAKLTTRGRDGKRWAEVYRYMAEHRASNSRYVQCMDYVTHIRGYLETLKQQDTYAHLT